MIFDGFSEYVIKSDPLWMLLKQRPTHFNSRKNRPGSKYRKVPQHNAKPMCGCGSAGCPYPTKRSVAKTVSK